MSDLDVIIPVHNEADSVDELVERLDKSLSCAGIDYNLIFVDDYSTDNTKEKIESYIFQKKLSLNGEIKNLKEDSSSKIIYDANGENGEANGLKVKLLPKKGRQGKAYSILEGAKASTASYIAMIDGDLQYPPEAIPKMYKLAENYGVVVAKRKMNGVSPLRKIGSKVNILIFEKLLLGLDCDTQSGLKVFKREIIEHLREEDVTPWTLDMPLLKTALELGHSIGTFEISFSERKSGKSKVNFVRTGFEIALSAIKLKLRNGKAYPIKPKNGELTVGVGFAHAARRFITHTNLPQEQSALTTFKAWQKFLLLSLVGLFLISLLVNPVATGIVVVSFLSVLYFADLLFSLTVLLKSLHFPPEISVADEDIKRLRDEDLPIYSVLCPLYKEADVLPQFIEAIKAIDWPKDRLDVILLLEEDDGETLDIAQRMDLPSYIKTLVVPPSLPKTKPKACNFGFAHIKGEYIVVYDAEDRPDPLQLKKAYVAFQKISPDIICLQSKLNYYNSQQNLLTRLFTAEYSLWFDLILPGLQSIETTIPLGGTSNHFKTRALRFLDVWDPFNVTEDCDLGARLFKAGFKTGILDSTTYEEANSRLGNWVRQRSRWIKGYMQTYLVHMRDPIDFLAKHGLHALAFQMVVGMRMVFMIINPILWLATFSYFALNSLVGPTIEALYPPLIFYIAVASLIFGNFVYLYNYMIGCAKRGQWGLIKHVFLVPFYWFFASCAAFLAFYQLIFKPHYWEKTKHGLHLKQAKHFLAELKIVVDIEKSIDIRIISELFGKVLNFLLALVKNFIDLIDLFVPLDLDNETGNGKLRILIFNWRDTKHVWAGGAEVYIQELGKRWVKQGHSVTVFCGWDGAGGRNGKIDGVNIIRRGGFYTVYPFAVVYYLLKLRGHFDIVVDSENGIPFFTPLFVGVPKILLIHHVHQEVFRKHLVYPLSTLAQFLESRLMPYVYQNPLTVTVSESSKKDIVELGLSEEGNIHVVTPGIDTSKFFKLPKSKDPAFVYLGRLKPYKNIDVAIEAFSRLHKKFPKARFTIAGFGESLEELKRLAKKLDLEEAVEFTGRVSDEQRARLLAESWVAIQPSSIEGWGFTVIEANASATPVIASDVRGLRDSVRDGVTGILVSPHDSQALSAAMERLVLDKDLRFTLSENASLWAIQFNWEKCADKFLRIIAQAVEEKAVLSIPSYARPLSKHG